MTYNQRPSRKYHAAFCAVPGPRSAAAVLFRLAAVARQARWATRPKPSGRCWLGSGQAAVSRPGPLHAGAGAPRGCPERCPSGRRRVPAPGLRRGPFPGCSPGWPEQGAVRGPRRLVLRAGGRRSSVFGRGAALRPGCSRARRTAVPPSAGRGRGDGGGGSVSPEPKRAGPSRRSGGGRGGRGGGAMWFMYVLSWLSLFIQVAFITLAVGESARPGSARVSVPASVLARGRIARAVASRGRRSNPGDSCPVLPACASLPFPVLPDPAPFADPSSPVGPRVPPGVTKPAPALPGSG